MPNGYRVRQINLVENVGSPAVGTLQPLQRSGQGPACARKRGSQRGGIATCSLNRSRRIPTPREFRSTGWSGRRGRSMCELRVRAEELATVTADVSK
jgi:hypothetical protein